MASADKLVAEAQRLVLAGAFDRAAPLFEQGALDLLRRRRLGEATAALLGAARLRMMLGQLDQAEALLGDAEAPARRSGQNVALLHARAELADARGERNARRRAWQAVIDATEGAQKLTALRKRAQIEREADQANAMLPLLDEAVRLAASLGARELQADALVERAAACAVLERLGEASAALDAAQALLTDEPSALRANLIGQRAVIARARGQADEALRFAVEARALAVASTDVQAYLAASMLLVTLHQEANRLVDAYDALLRARASLTDLLGEQAAGLVQPALDVFEERLGPAAFDAVHAEWAERRRQEKGGT